MTIMAMQRRNSAQNYYYFGLLLAGVVFSAVSRRLEPLLVVLPLVIALLHSRLTQDKPIFSVRCQMTPLRAFEGDRVSVELTIRAETDVPPTEIWHLVPPEAVCPGGRHRVLLALQEGEERTLGSRRWGQEEMGSGLNTSIQKRQAGNPLSILGRYARCPLASCAEK
jgi:hypothetical protein